MESIPKRVKTVVFSLLQLSTSVQLQKTLGQVGHPTSSELSLTL
jgi:hypothetical protein